MSLSGDGTLGRKLMLVRVIPPIILPLLFVSTSFAQQISTPDSPMSFGNPRAKNRIEVFYDCQCPTCVNFHAKLKALVERFPEKVFVTIRHYPLPMHNNAFMASTVVEAARRQGKGVEMIDLLLQEQSRWSTSENPVPIMFGYAKQLGLDAERFRTDLLGDEVDRAVLVDMDRGKRLGLTYVPSAFLNGKLLSFPDSLDIENVISKGN